MTRRLAPFAAVIVLLSLPSLATGAGSVVMKKPRFGVGAILGAHIPARRHELYDPDLGFALPFAYSAAEVGIRVSFTPLTFAALEVEAGIAPTKTSAGHELVLGVLRMHVRLQLPTPVQPFLVVGGGLIGVDYDAPELGSDTDHAFHWGAGIRLPFRLDVFPGPMPLFWLRMEGRQTITAHLGHSSTPSAHYEVLLGFGFTLEPPQPRVVVADAYLSPKEYR